MSRIYHTRFTRSGRLLRERRSMGEPHTVWLLGLIQIQGDAARGNAERRLRRCRGEPEHTLPIEGEICRASDRP